MNGLINLPKLGDVGAVGLLAIVALQRLGRLVYVLATGFFGGGVA